MGERRGGGWLALAFRRAIALTFAASLAAAVTGCGPDADDDSGAGDSGTGGSASQCTPQLTPCEALADRRLRCESPPPDRDTAIAECQLDVGIAHDRLNPCFLAAYTECLPGASCNNDDDCFVEGLLAADPSAFDQDAVDRCETTGEGCDDIPAGMLADCNDRAAECADDLNGDDLCVTVVVLAEPYKSEARACLQGECADLQDCIDGASGVSG